MRKVLKRVRWQEAKPKGDKQMLKPAYTRLVSIVFRSRASLVISLCLLIGSLALAILPITRGETIQSNQTAAPKTTSTFASLMQPGVLQLPSSFQPVVTTARAAS